MVYSVFKSLGIQAKVLPVMADTGINSDYSDEDGDGDEEGAVPNYKSQVYKEIVGKDLWPEGAEDEEVEDSAMMKDVSAPFALDNPHTQTA